MNPYGASNPYSPTLGNTAARLSVWLRGMLRMHRRRLVLLAGAGAVLAAAVSAGEAPAHRVIVAER